MALFLTYVHTFATEMKERARPELRDYDDSVGPSGTSTARKSANLSSARLIQRRRFVINLSLFVFLCSAPVYARELRIALLPCAVSKKSERRTSDAMCRFPSPSVVFRTSLLSSVPSLYACL